MRYRKEHAVATSQTSMSALHSGLMTGYLCLVTRDELVEHHSSQLSMSAPWKMFLVVLR